MIGSTQAPARTILVVDDDALLRTLAAEYFTRHGFGVYEASNAQAALAVIARGNPAIDVVFSDVNMPERMDGVNLFHSIANRWPHVPVLLASGNPLPDGANVPAASFFLKPYRLLQVHRSVEQLLSQRPQGPI